jgi:hypothetical protein
MKIFLLIYDRGERRLVSVTVYEQDERGAALAARYEAEVAAARAGRHQEIVLFEAESLDALKATHGSYFFSIDELRERFLKAAS